MKRWDSWIASMRTAIILMGIYALGLASATFLEKYYGTAAAKAMIYYSPLFFLLQGLMALNFLAILFQRKGLNRGRWGFLLTHIALLVILAGAMVSHVIGEEGILHLREGECSDQLQIETDRGTLRYALPFEVELVRFTLTRYPGSASPSAYESELLVHVDGQTIPVRVSMNNVLDVKGYRFFQASYDPDEKGTVLSVNRDVEGRNITYTGYLLLLAGLLYSLFGSHTRFRQLARQLNKLDGKVLIGIVGCCCCLSAWAQTAVSAAPAEEIVLRQVVDPSHAARFGRLPMQSPAGRMMPINTFSSELLRKLHKADRFGQLNGDQFLLSLLVMPEKWVHIPLIAFSNQALANYYELSTPACAYVELFDTNGHYKLQERLEAAYAKMPAQRNAFDKDLIKLDEQINIFHQLIRYQWLPIFPLRGDPAHKWYAPGEDLSAFSGKDSLFVSQIMGWYLQEVREGLKTDDWKKADEVLAMIDTYQQAQEEILDIRPAKMEAEIRYNQLDLFRQCKKGYLILGGLLLVCAFAALFNPRRSLRYVMRGLIGLIIGVFLLHIYGMGMRWYIGGYAPWSNSYETMVYVAWATVCAGLFFLRKSTLTFALATLFGGVILFVSGLNWMDPQIGTLVPVLKSPWLMFHVAVIVGAYGFFGISCLIGLTNLVMMSLSRQRTSQLVEMRIRELSLVSEMSLWVGLALMTVGTFLGAIWANESWGRYWGWDPKETWALITMIVYAIVTHLRMAKDGCSLWLFNLLSVIAFYSVLMTFLGVNYLLSGMHSYGQNDHVDQLFFYFYLSLFLVALLAFFAHKRQKR
ncbi:MAG: cytochrome c biogenesis protein CcsA [Parabacteroides sp.]|nr:cytochrome c biogenesis protein CcsA [Parabacteroides sp.]MCI7783220.1 cytochrome c biogenesis protein CcsA [Parabacteroides sp.]MDD7063246.1 cytochrome c biogenesis protein CcsA [bacterium]MDY4756559.1 cytochrome c biogenesis protein CcsA [Parabacteroides sp.]